jgi:hypothetical protein
MGGAIIKKGTCSTNTMVLYHVTGTPRYSRRVMPIRADQAPLRHDPILQRIRRRQAPSAMRLCAYYVAISSSGRRCTRGGRMVAASPACIGAEMTRIHRCVRSLSVAQGSGFIRVAAVSALGAPVMRDFSSPQSLASSCALQYDTPIETTIGDASATRWSSRTSCWPLRRGIGEMNAFAGLVRCWCWTSWLRWVTHVVLSEWRSFSWRLPILFVTALLTSNCCRLRHQQRCG